jgi:hypothetical protein
MLIAIDFDGTITEDIQCFYELKKTFEFYHHEIIIVTMRYLEEEEYFLNRFKQEGIKVIYTGRKAKLDFLSNMNIFPDIWIDDNPKWIYEDSK